MIVKKQEAAPRYSKIEKGQSLIELAVSLVLLLLILAGIFDLGRAILSYFILQDAAEEGIVYGVSFPTDCYQIALRIRSNLEGTLVDDTYSIAVDIEDASGGYTACYSIPYAQVYASKKMQITLKYDFQISMPFLGAFTGQTIPMTITTNGVILRPPPPTTP
jgi:hypothetical protein